MRGFIVGVAVVVSPVACATGGERSPDSGRAPSSVGSSKDGADTGDGAGDTASDAGATSGLTDGGDTQSETGTASTDGSDETGTDTGGDSEGDTSTTGGASDACCSANLQLGCTEDPGIETCVCTQDAFCCTMGWDAMCVAGADACGSDCSNAIEDCCLTANFPGCSSQMIVDCVCFADRFCCEEAWDATCVTQAELCGAPC